MNLYGYVHNNPVNAVDVNGLWTFGFGLQASQSILYSIGLNIGLFFGHDPGAAWNSGWSVGVLGGPAVGVGGPVNLVSGGGFFQVTTAKCVNQLKGFSFQAGGSATVGPGTGPNIGGEGIVGLDYNGQIVPTYYGGEVDFGWGLSLPVEAHATLGLTVGIDTDGGWH